MVKQWSPLFMHEHILCIVTARRSVNSVYETPTRSMCDALKIFQLVSWILNIPKKFEVIPGAMIELTFSLIPGGLLNL